jgi:BioD-like phosphotransacetylase family protein
MISKTNIPVIICQDDSYAVASKINQMTVKTQPSDTDKIPVIKNLISKNIDLDLIASAFQTESSIAGSLSAGQ